MKKRIKTGIPGLDTLLEGGFLPGRTILVSGSCGVGKSILAMQFIYNGIAKYNEKGLYVSFEEDKERIIENMKTIGLDVKKLERSNKLIIVGGALGRLSHFMEKVDAEMDHVIEEVAELIKNNNIKRVVIDSSSLFTLLAKNNEERRKSLTNLSNRLSSLGCTSILTSETREGSMDISRHGIEEFVVDGVIALYQLRLRDQFVPGIAIRKMRGTNHNRSIKLFKITNKGIEVYPNETLFTDL